MQAYFGKKTNQKEKSILIIWQYVWHSELNKNPEPCKVMITRLTVQILLLKWTEEQQIDCWSSDLTYTTLSTSNRL